MFDIGFTEMITIAVVALVVIGPKDLPKVARKAGEWIGKLRRYVDEVKSDLNKQMELEELRNLKTQVTDAAKSIESSISGTISEVKSDFGQIENSLSGAPAKQEPVTDWDKIYAVRRQRQKLKDRRLERERELGIKRKPIIRRS